MWFRYELLSTGFHTARQRVAGDVAPLRSAPRLNPTVRRYCDPQARIGWIGRKHDAEEIT
jgi:hypothetical protein